MHIKGLLNVTGFFVSSAMAVLFHFLYELSGQNVLISLFTPVNESVWEHIKLVYFPFLFWAVFEFFVLKPDIKRYFVAKCTGLVICISGVLVLFYTYSGILGFDVLFVDIAITFLVLAIAFYFCNRLYTKYSFSGMQFYASVILIIIMTSLFFAFTFCPLNLSLFTALSK